MTHHLTRDFRTAGMSAAFALLVLALAGAMARVLVPEAICQFGVWYRVFSFGERGAVHRTRLCASCTSGSKVRT